MSFESRPIYILQYQMTAQFRDRKNDVRVHGSLAISRRHCVLPEPRMASIQSHGLHLFYLLSFFLPF